jgi:hypothetical protein
MVSSPSGNNCTVSEEISGTLGALVWPPEFIAAAKFVQTDYVNAQECNLFQAMDFRVDGYNIHSLQVWVNNVTGYPCEILYWDLASSLRTTWSFTGFSKFIPPEATQCTAAELICNEPGWICTAKSGFSSDTYGMALQWICQRLDCSPINPYGPHFEPNTVYDHTNWAFNTYFQAFKTSQGFEACDFNGLGELVPPQARTVSDIPKVNWLPFYRNFTC